MGFRDNLEEKEELRQYRKKEKLFLFALFFGLSLFLLTMISSFVGSGTTLRNYIVRVPFSGATRGIDIFLTMLAAGYFFWYKGFKIPLPAKMTSKIPFLSDDIRRKKIENGKVKELEEFFYPKVEFSDGIPRGKGFHYFKSKRYTLSNLFDFGKYSGKNGTKELISLFRDKEIEKAKLAVKSSRKKRKKKAQERLDAMTKVMQENICTPNQEHLYHDLFLMLEGIYKSYSNKFGDKIFIDPKMKSPLRLLKFKESGKMADVTVDKSVDVFRDSKVYFSIDMIMQTVKDLTHLYIIFLEKRLERGRFKSIDKKNLVRFEMFFKFFMTRRILLNYSNIPSGWICVKVEDYTMRAIASNIDREMIIDINEKNNGSTPAYDSDVEASQFLFTYWAFFYEEKIRRAMDEIEFIYSATKEVKEINAREVARNAMKEIEQEWQETYDAFNDDDIIVLQPKEKEEA